MGGQVRFYTLCRRFVDGEKPAGESPPPPQVVQLKHYALAIGHHVGVVDCLTPVLTMGAEDYFAWVRKLPEGPARKKLEGLARFGELEINRSHLAPLASALSAAGADFGPEERQWAESLLRLLRSMAEEPAIYLVVRLHGGTGDDRRQSADGR